MVNPGAKDMLFELGFPPVALSSIGFRYDAYVDGTAEAELAYTETETEGHQGL